mgnify:FL=1
MLSLDLRIERGLKLGMIYALGQLSNLSLDLRIERGLKQVLRRVDVLVGGYRSIFGSSAD